MRRLVQREWLDELAPGDPGAIRSRRDLQRLNAWMGNAGTVARTLRRIFRRRKPQRLAELGAGDGKFLRGVARRLPGDWKGVQVLLLDQLACVPSQVAGGFKELGWRPELVQADVFEWLKGPAEPVWDVMVANLFLHHFSEGQLAELLAGVARRTNVFIAVEPRRSALALAGSRLCPLIGCNRVTRHDAPISVRAGFAGRELSGLWPAATGWSPEERSAGLFSHLFVAKRRS